MRTAITLLVTLLAGSCVYAQDQPLGDLARQQKSAAHAKAKRVVTDENLPHASPAEASNGALVVPKPAAANDSENKSAAPNGSGSQAATPAETQKRIAELKDTEAAQQRAVKKFEEELKDNSMNADRKQLFEDGLHNAQQLLEQATAERMKAEKALGTKADAADKSSEEVEANASTDVKAEPEASDKAAQGKSTEPKSSESKSAEPNTNEASPADSKADDPAKAAPTQGDSGDKGQSGPSAN